MHKPDRDEDQARLLDIAACHRSAVLGRAPAWMPDNLQLVFASDRDSSRELYTMTIDGSRQRRITADAPTSLHEDQRPLHRDAHSQCG